MRMVTSLVVGGVLLAGVGWHELGAAPAAPAFVPAAAKDVPGYFADRLPCRINKVVEEDFRFIEVVCKGDLLEGKSLRELAILRNTIYARYGWDGFRKEWLRGHFRKQPWFKANKAFSYKLLNENDRQNAHFIGAREAAFPETQLRQMKETIEGRGNRMTPEDRIELGLISRQLGSFAVDADGARASVEKSLDGVLDPSALRQLSLRDLRILRNTIYARRGRPFKSEVLRAHFRQLRWYKENAGYTDKLLSANDRRNIRLIKSVEDEFGGALRDEDWLIEPLLDGA